MGDNGKLYKWKCNKNEIGLEIIESESPINELNLSKLKLDYINFVLNTLNKKETINDLIEYLKDKKYHTYLYNIYRSINNYINYINSNTYKDDLYILPVIKNILSEFNNYTFIVFEDKNGDVRIKVPIDKYEQSTNNMILLYKNREIYDPIYFQDNKKEKDIFN